MLESIVSKITNVVRNSLRAIAAATASVPWFTAAVILALFFVVV
jgi:hypothetical protein